MSKQLDLSKPISQDEIDFLLQRHPVEKVQYWVEVSNSGQFDENLEKADYEKLTVGDLQDELNRRDLKATGNKADLIKELEESDERRRSGEPK